MLKTIEVHDVKSSDQTLNFWRSRENEFVWWPNNDKQILKNHYALQKYLLTYPGHEMYLNDSYRNPTSARKGMINTIHALHELDGQKNNQYHLLRTGALFPLIGSSSLRGKDFGGSIKRSFINQEYRHSLELTGLEYSPWSHQHTLVLPEVNNSKLYEYDEDRDTDSFLTSVDHHVKMCLNFWTPVIIHFLPGSNQEMVKAIQSGFSEETKSKIALRTEEFEQHINDLEMSF